MSRDPEKISVMDHVQKQWMQRRICFKHEDQEPIREEEAPRGRGRPKPSCLDAKHCLCGEAGDAVWELYQKVVAIMRKSMKNPCTKKAMQNTDLVFNLTALPEGTLAYLLDGDIAPGNTDADVLDPDGQCAL